MEINKVLAQEFKLRQEQIDNTIALFDDGKTIPFVARYRKEVTGSLDDQILREIFDRMTYLRNLEKRKEEIIALIDEQGKLTDEIRESVSNAATLVEAEDIYRPFKPKRKTRASVAREKGLEPLADAMLTMNDSSIEKEAEKYSKEEFKKKLEELKTLHDQEIKDLKESDEFKKKLAKKEAAERTKEGRKITGELAKGITGISGDNKLGQLKNGLSAAFHNKDGSLDVAQGLQATTQAIAEFARQLDGTVEKIASQKGIIDTNLQGSRRSTGGAFGIGGSY